MPYSVLEELIRTARLAERRLAWEVESAGLKPTEFGVLSCLEEQGESTTSELARVLMVRHQGLGQQINEMVEAGLIERTGPQGRGRPIGLQITEAGLSALNRARPYVVQANSPSSLGLTASERDKIALLLAQVRDTLDDAELP